MAKVTIPCRQCPACGCYSDVSRLMCVCGQDISMVPATLIDKDVPIESFGEIDQDVEYYIQRCSACGTENYTDSPEHPVEYCRECQKRRVASVVPISADKLHSAAPLQGEIETAKEECIAEEDASSGQDDDFLEESPFGALLSNISISVRGSEEVSAGIHSSRDVATANVSASRKRTKLVLTALQGGPFQVTIMPERTEVLLGRAGEWDTFFEQDTRVSNEHCYIRYSDGQWLVRDNYSRNGTQVNQKPLPPGGESELASGMNLKLGNQPDSIALRISIEDI